MSFEYFGGVIVLLVIDYLYGTYVNTLVSNSSISQIKTIDYSSSYDDTMQCLDGNISITYKNFKTF